MYLQHGRTRIFFLSLLIATALNLQAQAEKTIPADGKRLCL
jgi:hypothetical protein